MEEKKEIKIKLTTVVIMAIILGIIVLGIIGINHIQTSEEGYNNAHNCTNSDEINNNHNSLIPINYIDIDIAKPVIYLYPKEDMELEVKLGYSENLTCVYPEYNNGWKVIAKPDGTLINQETGREYYSLYYESINTKKYTEELREGFVVSKEEIGTFLEDKLELLGLNYKEAEEFIIYWLPRLQSNPYVYIRFQTAEEIENNMPLYISQEPDTLIRVVMEWKGLDEKIEVQEQQLERVTRKGFTVVEWGGTEIK